MRRLSSGIGIAAALIATPLTALPAWADACPTASATAYNTMFAPLSGNSCTVDGLTFSNFVITPSTTGLAAISNITVAPFSTVFNGATEFGLQLLFAATAQSSPGQVSVADIAWTYNVAGNFINDVFASITGSTTGTGAIGLAENLTNGVTLHLTDSGVTGASFSPIGSLGVMKDEFARAGLDGFATDSIVQNGFSLVPAPIVGAGLPGLIAACGGLVVLARRRRKLVA
jgi:hypothetical protein